MARYLTYKRKKQHGLAIVTVLLLSSLLFILAATSAKVVINSLKDTNDQFVRNGQASNVAQAGLQDALGWFKRQSVQPVRNTVGTPPCDDYGFKPLYNVDDLESATVDEEVGIVRDMPIYGNVYGRYIVKRQPCSTEGSYSGYLKDAVHDITEARGKSGAGVVWELHSTGIIYMRKDYGKKADGYSFLKGPSDSPNRILRTATASVEISRLDVNTHKAPITQKSTGTNSSFNSRCYLIGDSETTARIYYYDGGPNPPGENATRSIPPPGSNDADKSISVQPTVENVFAVSQNELRGMADNVYTNINQVPDNILFSITYLDGNFTFDVTRPLSGSGILFVNGNLTLADSSNSLFAGVIYVTGRLTMGRDNSLSGNVIADSVNCTPGTGQSSFEYNDNLVINVRNKLGLYRANNLTHTFKE